MIDIRRIALSEGGKKPQAMKLADGKAEAAILEIAELAYVLKADGFPEVEIFKRIGRVYQPAPQVHEYPLGGEPLFYYLRDYIAAHCPDYLDINWMMLFRCAVGIAELWAELFAERLIASSWPPADILSEPWCVRSYAGYVGVRRVGRAKRKDFAQLTGNLGDLDVLLAEASKALYSSESARAYRRMKARAVPGDVLCGYSTGARGWRIGMGSARIALVRDGRSIDHVETRYGG